MKFSLVPMLRKRNKFGRIKNVTPLEDEEYVGETFSELENVAKTLKEKISAVHSLEDFYFTINVKFE